LAGRHAAHSRRQTHRILMLALRESMPGPFLEIGNTNSRYWFPIGARRSVNEWNVHGPAHHCVVGTGHIASKIQKLGELLHMETLCVLLQLGLWLSNC
jgi:L-arabinose isomerase